MAHQRFWETMNILVGKEWKRSGREVMDDVQDWVDKVVVRKQKSKLDVNDYFLKAGDEQSCASVCGNRSDVAFGPVTSDEDIQIFLMSLKLPKINCNFRHPKIRSRLERLMGSNYVSLTDRNYMQKLQKRIREDYADSMDKRIKVRENEEMVRVKNLVLLGKIPLDQAPPEMADHPVMLIANYCTQLIAERRKKIKIPRVTIPTYLYRDDTSDPPSGLSIEEGHIFRQASEKICIPIDHYLQATFEEEIANGYMLTQEEFEQYKYESELVKELMECETVERMYELAEEIIGALENEAIEEIPTIEASHSITST